MKKVAKWNGVWDETYGIEKKKHKNKYMWKQKVNIEYFDVDILAP